MGHSVEVPASPWGMQEHWDLWAGKGCELGGEDLWTHTHTHTHGLPCPRTLKRDSSKRWAAPLSPAWQTWLVYSSGAPTVHVPRRQVGAGAGRGPTAPSHPSQTRLWLREQTQLSTGASTGLAAVILELLFASQGDLAVREQPSKEGEWQIMFASFWYKYIRQDPSMEAIPTRGKKQTKLSQDRR